MLGYAGFNDAADAAVARKTDLVAVHFQ
jgi:hypothetical protein